MAKLDRLVERLDVEAVRRADPEPLPPEKETQTGKHRVGERICLLVSKMPMDELLSLVRSLSHFSKN